MKKHSELGRRLKAERKRLEITQRDLAAKLGVDKSSVYGFERGDRPPNAFHLAVLGNLGADVIYILSGIRGGSAVPDDWLHRVVQVMKELDEANLWEKFTWNERERLLAKFLRVA